VLKHHKEELFIIFRILLAYYCAGRKSEVYTKFRNVFSKRINIRRWFSRK